MIKDSFKQLFKTEEKQKVLPLKQANYLNQMSLKEFLKLMQSCELHHFLNLSPEIKNKKVLLFSFQTTHHFIPKLLGLKPTTIVNYQVESNYPSIKKNVLSVKGSLNPIALKSNIFDSIFLPLATKFDRSFDPYFSEITRLMINKSKMIISLIHPQTRWLINNQNPNSDSKNIYQLSDYINLFKKHGLYVEKMEELKIDEKLKPFFSSSKLISKESQHYEEFKNFPLIVMFKLIRYQKDQSNHQSSKDVNKLEIEDNTQYLKNIYGL